MKIAQQNRRLSASNDKNYEHQKEKPKHIIQLRRPNRIENEEQLNKNAAKRQNASHHDARQWLSVDGLFRDESRYLVGSHWMFERLEINVNLVKNAVTLKISFTYPFPESKERPDES